MLQYILQMCNMTLVEKEELSGLIREIEDADFECEAGPLYNYTSWQRLRGFAGLPVYSDDSLHKSGSTSDRVAVNSRINATPRETDNAG